MIVCGWSERIESKIDFLDNLFNRVLNELFVFNCLGINDFLLLVKGDSQSKSLKVQFLRVSNNKTE